MDALWVMAWEIKENANFVLYHTALNVMLLSKPVLYVKRHLLLTLMEVLVNVLKAKPQMERVDAHIVKFKIV